ncbi:hypothetical protein AB4Y45_33605 [Paraburkholderia sp. EG287A]|uniref:hypothetical protein n=1 Tax=Paraburkholderia sp. EG287A TaxID=3237012 RepID=UPI0034D2CE66
MSDSPKRLFAVVGTVVSIHGASKRFDGRERRPYVYVLVGPEGQDPLRAEIALTEDVYEKHRAVVRPATRIELNGYIDAVPFFDNHISELVADSLHILKMP